VEAGARCASGRGRGAWACEATLDFLHAFTTPALFTRRAAATTAEPGESEIIELTGDEAPVLFEFVSRYTDTRQLQIETQAEQTVLWNIWTVLWNICALLERTLVEPPRADFDQSLDGARDRVRDDED
jgi:hypothetical protein